MMGTSVKLARTASWPVAVIVGASLYNVYTKRQWEHFLVMHGGLVFPTLYAKPITPARKRWRRVMRLLKEENK